MFAGCAPGVFTIESRALFHSITGCPDSSARPRRLRLLSAFGCGVVRAYALAATPAAAPSAPSANPTANSRNERRLIMMLLSGWLLWMSCDRVRPVGRGVRVIAGSLPSRFERVVGRDRSGPGVEAAAIATEEDGEDIVPSEGVDAGVGAGALDAADDEPDRGFLFVCVLWCRHVSPPLFRLAGESGCRSRGRAPASRLGEDVGGRSASP
jgi:hypothetical protein